MQKKQTITSKKLKIAIIGSGISGLTCAYLLDKKHDITIYEKNNYIGGHTHTHTVYEDSEKLNIDSGFIVYNENTYPNFINLLNQLKVESQKTQMGFSVKDVSKDFEYSGNSISAIFAKKSNIFNPLFLNMIKSIIMFNRQSIKDLHTISSDLTLHNYLQQNNYSNFFIDKYIAPMAAAIWSTNSLEILKMPAKFFIRFFNNHGLLQITKRPQWWVIKKGSKQYVKKIINNIQGKVLLDHSVTSVKRTDENVIIRTNNNESIYDYVIFANHSNQALNILSNPNSDEIKILGSIKYQKNIATIHTDTSILPKRKIAWSSWNYSLDSKNKDKITLTYNMNILQNLSSNKTYCVTLNKNQPIDDNKIIKEVVYHHPLFNVDSVKSQSSKELINGRNRSYFCGAYWANGFHEDGVNSALDVCKEFGVYL